MRKRSVTIDGHRTSISLEDGFWEELAAIAEARRLSLNALVAEIDRARKLYEERVSPTVTARGSYFQQELVQTLADGDPALLGSSA